VKKDQTIRNTSKHILLIFVKYPELGKVKTRLAQDIGYMRATQIYSVMAKTIIDTLSKSKTHRTIIFFDPPDRKADLKLWLRYKLCTFLPQEGNSLGERMVNAFKKAFSLRAKKAVIIGTDCIGISNKLISKAFNTLNQADVVLGPAEDGGYYLLGLNKLVPEIFNNIDWSTNLVLNQTSEKLRKKGLKLKLLQTLKDIDTLSDLNDELLLKIQKIASNLD
jgi:rSAM/selenodomain-associated transferase 1